MSIPGWVPAPDSFVYVPRSEITGSYGHSVSFFWESIKAFAMVVEPVYISTSKAVGFHLLHTLIRSHHFLVWDPRHPRGRAVVSCGCDFWFPGNQWCWASHELIDHLHVFGEMSSQALCPLLTGLLVFLLLSCRGSLDIPDMSIIRNMICNYFLPFSELPFHSVGYPPTPPPHQILNFGEV